MDNYNYVVTKAEDKEPTKELTISYQCEESYNCHVYSTDRSLRTISYSVVKDSNEPRIHEVKYNL